MEEKKPGFKTSEMTFGGLAGASVFTMATTLISPDMSLGAGIATGCAILATGALGYGYIAYRTKHKAENGGGAS